MEEKPIKDWRGRILGYIQTKPNGDKILRDFYRKILGKYDKRTNTTRDFYNRLVAKGDNLLLLLNK